MIDREKVINGLKCIAEIGECDCNNCDYANDGGPATWYKCQKLFARDAIELLAALEPVEPKRDFEEYPDGSAVFELYFCGACGEDIEEGQEYCCKCGRKVKWND